MNAGLCLSLDIDWAHDAVIVDALELLQRFEARATWFVTHPTPQLEAIRRAGHDLGLHPNFNPLLEGSAQGSAEAVVDWTLALAPDARCVRSHSLTRSSRLAHLFRARGLTHESNLLIPAQAAPDLLPWRDWTGLVNVPIRWEDDVRVADATMGEPTDLLGATALLTVDFHPVHLFLNTTVEADYENARDDFNDPVALLRRRRPEGSGGVRDWFVALLTEARRTGAEGLMMADLKPDWSR